MYNSGADRLIRIIPRIGTKVQDNLKILPPSLKLRRSINITLCDKVLVHYMHISKLYNAETVIVIYLHI